MTDTDHDGPRRAVPDRRPPGSARVLFLTSNGAGLGHLTRSAAIGRRLPEPVTPSVFTLSQAAPLIAGAGFPVEFLYSRTYAGTSGREWNELYQHRLEALIAEQAPAVVSFDGTFPYRGLAQTIPGHPDITWVWTRRAMWREDVGQRNLERAELFDAIVEPGEYAAERDPGITVARRSEAHCVAPIVYSRADELQDRAAACEELGIDPDGTNVLVQLGAGNINDIASTAGLVVRRLSSAGATVVVPVSPIASSIPELPPGVRVVRVYPLAPLFRAFDASIAASGYNSFHELLRFGVPTLFVPNREAVVDDQGARAEWARDTGAGLMAEADDPEALATQVDALLDPDVRAAISAVVDTLDDGNGATEAAEILADLALADVPEVGAT